MYISYPIEPRKLNGEGTAVPKESIGGFLKKRTNAQLMCKEL